MKTNSNKWREEFNKKFRNESWYPDGWYEVEQYIETLLSDQEKAIGVRQVDNMESKDNGNI